MGRYLYSYLNFVFYSLLIVVTSVSASLDYDKLEEYVKRSDGTAPPSKHTTCALAPDMVFLSNKLQTIRVPLYLINSCQIEDISAEWSCPAMSTGWLSAQVNDDHSISFPLSSTLLAIGGEDQWVIIKIKTKHNFPDSPLQTFEYRAIMAVLSQPNYPRKCVLYDIGGTLQTKKYMNSQDEPQITCFLPIKHTVNECLQEGMHPLFYSSSQPEQLITIRRWLISHKLPCAPIMIPEQRSYRTDKPIIKSTATPERLETLKKLNCLNITEVWVNSQNGLSAYLEHGTPVIKYLSWLSPYSSNQARTVATQPFNYTHKEDLILFEKEHHSGDQPYIARLTVYIKPGTPFELGHYIQSNRDAMYQQYLKWQAASQPPRREPALVMIQQPKLAPSTLSQSTLPFMAMSFPMTVQAFPFTPPSTTPIMMPASTQKTTSHSSLAASEPSQEKPPHSYKVLIQMVIQESQRKKLQLNEIYAAISSKFPYYKMGEGSWQNSIRHNLSLNECFIKTPVVNREACSGKGNLWSYQETSDGDTSKPPRKKRCRREADSTSLPPLPPQQSAGNTASFLSYSPQMTQGMLPAAPDPAVFGNSMMHPGLMLTSPHLAAGCMYDSGAGCLTRPPTLTPRSTPIPFRPVMPPTSTTDFWNH